MKKIKLSNGKHALVDDADFVTLSGYKWQGDGAYCSRKTEKPIKKIYMHRQIMDFPSCLIDHINHNGIDNRRSNLRLCDHSQNLGNSRLRKDSTTLFKGVKKMKEGNYQARVTCRGKRYHLGTYKTPTEAHEVYSIKAKELFGNFANL